VQAGLILEVDADGVIVVSHGEFHGLDGLAFCFGEAKELTELRGVDGAFSFCSSHICLPLSGDVVRARSVLVHRALPVYFFFLYGPAALGCGSFFPFCF
jgi:hypothetical protein